MDDVFRSVIVPEEDMILINEGDEDNTPVGPIGPVYPVYPVYPVPPCAP